jgi:hypothetical protein
VNLNFRATTSPPRLKGTGRVVGFEDLAITFGGRKLASPLVGLVDVLPVIVRGSLSASNFEAAGLTALNSGPRVGDWCSTLAPLVNLLSNMFFIGDLARSGVDGRSSILINFFVKLLVNNEILEPGEDR